MQSADEGRPSARVVVLKGQMRHALGPTRRSRLMSAYVPTEQLTAIPPEHHAPAGQSAHSDWLRNPLIAPTVPSPHGTGAADAFGHQW